MNRALFATAAVLTLVAPCVLSAEDNAAAAVTIRLWSKREVRCRQPTLLARTESPEAATYAATDRIVLRRPPLGAPVDPGQDAAVLLRDIRRIEYTAFDEVYQTVAIVTTRDGSVFGIAWRRVFTAKDLSLMKQLPKDVAEQLANKVWREDLRGLIAPDQSIHRLRALAGNQEITVKHLLQGPFVETPPTEAGNVASITFP